MLPRVAKGLLTFRIQHSPDDFAHAGGFARQDEFETVAGDEGDVFALAGRRSGFVFLFVRCHVGLLSGGFDVPIPDGGWCLLRI